MQDFIRHVNTNNFQACEDHNINWSPDITSLALGLIVGIFVTIVGFRVADSKSEQRAPIDSPIVEEVEAPLILEFYETLKTYEVPIRLPR